MEAKEKLARATRRDFLISGQHSIAHNVMTTLLVLIITIMVTEPLFRLMKAPQNIIVVYMLAIFIISAITDGYLYGIVATFLGVFIYDFLITLPRFSFSFTVGFPLTLLVMLLVSLAASTITAQIKTKALVAEEKEQRAGLLYDINRDLLSARDIPSIAACANEYLGNYLHRSVLFFPKDPLEDDTCYFRQADGDLSMSFFFDDKEKEAAHLAYIQRDVTGCDTPQDNGSHAMYRPVLSSGNKVLGVVAVSCKRGELSPSDNAFLELICQQAATALRAQYLSEAQQTTQLVAETEKARSSFLQGISHDLRTPLTSIIGASTVLRDKGDALDGPTRHKLVDDIHSDAEWLLRMVENILSVTRIHDDRMRVHKTLEAAEEVVGETVSSVRKRFPSASIAVSAPSELLVVPMDAILISQVIINLIENALAHAGVPSPHVDMDVTQQGNMALFSVRDNGKGIDPAVQPHLFEMQPKYGALILDASRGLGMGLSICKTIVTAHGGAIEGHNHPEGGAVFTFTLPLEMEETHG